MTARDAINEYVYDVSDDDMTAVRDLQGYLDSFARAVAHELAEKIRDEADADTSADTDICTCWRSAADFIDPEVP